MSSQELLNYIRQHLRQGVSKEQIKQSLLASGWQEKVIEEGFFSYIPSPSLLPISKTGPLSFFKKYFSKASISASTTIAIITVIIISGGAFAYLKYYYLTPEKMVQKIVSNLVDIKSAEYSGEAKIETENAGIILELFDIEESENTAKTSNFLINFSHSLDIEDFNDQKTKTSFSIKASLWPENSNILGMDVINKNNLVNFKVNDAPSATLFGMINLGALEQIKNQWIKSEVADLRDSFELYDADEPIYLSPENLERIKTAIKQAPLFKKIEEIGNETVDGVKTWHYKLTINKTELIKLWSEINKIRFDLTQKRADYDFQDALDLFGSVEISPLETWISKKDYMPYKISFGIVSEEFDGSVFTTKMDTNITFNNFNKPIRIDMPGQSTPLDQMQDVLDNLLGYNQYYYEDEENECINSEDSEMPCY